MNDALFSEPAAAPTSSSMTAARVTAMSAGDLAKAALSEVRRVLKENRGNQLSAAKAGIQELLERGLITRAEARELNTLCDSIFGAIRKKDVAAKSAVQVQQMYQTLIADRDASPVALAITSVANSAFSVQEIEPEQSGVLMATVTITPETTAGGAVIGGIIGGVIGAVVGGGVGAGVGAAIGGAAGAAIGACNESGQ